MHPWYPTSNRIPNLMSHRKTEHGNDIVCKRFIQGQCHFTGDSCWFSHSTNEYQPPQQPQRNTYAQTANKNYNQKQVFQNDTPPSETPPAGAPPSVPPQDAEQILMRMFNMMKQMPSQTNIVM